MATKDEQLREVLSGAAMTLLELLNQGLLGKRDHTL